MNDFEDPVKEGIYLLSSERSGSNLLRRLLGNHPDISAPVPPHLFSSFSTVAERYIDFSNRAMRLRLLEAMRALCNHRFSDWKLRASADEIDERFQPGGVAACVDSIYRAKAHQDGKMAYVCKENFLFQYTDSIERLSGKINWLHLVRDPRDVVASWLRQGLLYLNEYDAARRWAIEQRAIAELERASRIAPFRVQYESLVSDPRYVMTGILRYLGLPPVEACFDNEDTAPEASRNRLWRNLATPVTDRWVGAWRNRLKPRQVRTVELVCGDTMTVFGYSPEYGIGADEQAVPPGKFRDLLARSARALGSMSKSRALIRSRERMRSRLVADLKAARAGMRHPNRR